RAQAKPHGATRRAPDPAVRGRAHDPLPDPGDAADRAHLRGRRCPGRARRLQPPGPRRLELEGDDADRVPGCRRASPHARRTDGHRPPDVGAGRGLRAGFRHLRRGPRARERREDRVGPFPALRAFGGDARAPAPRRGRYGRRRSSALPRERRAEARGARRACRRSQLRFLLLAAACLLLAAGCFPGAAQAQIQSDWERANEDRLRQSGEKPVPPPPLNRSRLVELKQDFSARSDFRYYVDWGSVSTDEDRIVRYVLLARTAAGVENITFEGLRCQGEYRVYAVGRPEGGWGGKPSEWRAIPRSTGMPPTKI